MTGARSTSSGSGRCYGGSRLDLPDELSMDCWRNNPRSASDVMGRLEWERPSVTIAPSSSNPRRVASCTRRSTGPSPTGRRLGCRGSRTTTGGWGTARRSRGRLGMRCRSDSARHWVRTSQKRSDAEGSVGSHWTDRRAYQSNSHPLSLARGDVISSIDVFPAPVVKRAGSNSSGRTYHACENLSAVLAAARATV